MNGDANLALFCDFENVALGVRDAKLPAPKKFDIGPILERLLLKGSIVVKKAYCDWARYKEYKAAMHEAAFEMIEIPHVRQSGKNSADIRLVVDALDLCYTKEHIDTFVVLSGDSDFSPLVAKLRENAKFVIGVGVKNATSDLLVASCDEFLYYDDLVAAARPEKRAPKRAKRTKAQAASETSHESEKKRDDKAAPPVSAEEDPVQEAVDLVIETTSALYGERGERAKIWGSMVKQTLKRRRPGFSESTYGFRSFSDLLEEAQARGDLDLEMDERSGGYIIRGIA